MSRFSHYGSGQRVAFAMLCIGFGLCCVGAVVPFWLKSEVSLSDVSFGFFRGMLGDYNLVKLNLGAWVFCLELVGSDTKCYNMYGSDEDFIDSDSLDDEVEPHAWIYLVRLAIALNIKLSLICGICACCRCMCCSGGRTICHGVFSFLAGAFGIFAVAVMSARKEDLVAGLSLLELEYDWGFYIYAVGSCVLILASFFLCFSLPKELPSGMVLMSGNAPYITVTHGPQNVVTAPTNQYELNGQIQSFEPITAGTIIHPPPPPQY